MDGPRLPIVRATRRSPLLSRWPIRYKLWIGFVTLCCIVAVLAFVGFRGVYSFRELTKSIKARSNELPLAADLTQRVANLRVVISRRPQAIGPGLEIDPSYDDRFAWRQELSSQLMAVKGALEQYKAQLESSQSVDTGLVENARERETVRQIEVALAAIEHVFDNHDWILQAQYPKELNERLSELQLLTAKLPSFMQQGMDDFAIDARSQYRAWIGMTWAATIFGAIMLLGLARQFYAWIFHPLKMLIQASRRVARGDFEHRVHLSTSDEMSELAGAMNAMTNRFQQIRDDLDLQVKLRTKEVVRSEQLASVGFLAAGVAHEINNPLASIAWAAESLESRVFEMLHDDEAAADSHDNEEVEILQTYLRKIQEEAFRCKGITDRLLDYSRMGDVEKQDTNMPELVEGVIDMVRHLGKYREKQIEFKCDEPVVAPVNSQEIKQVILNLLTNGLDSLDPGGKITVDVGRSGNQAELLVTDNGCGMTEEVMEHLFEPFFTRRRDGQGTGLGLSITYRIIADHGGTIEVSSDGPGKGSQFRVILPLVKNEEDRQEQLQAA